MSDETSDDPGPVSRVYRTVTPGYRGHDDPGMNAVGWAILLGLMVMFAPLLPFIVIVWLISKVVDALTPGNHL
ncbi:DUF7535 family protein [Candidatus Halobonum tyrrellensis]|uniref:Uncharacterized protein n=1 Tax=Candidatus Halobonum tyrrellensis G22 TaxID=1324957 RepID=V4HIG2_9EURY|nr:hypothetical protein [Candidatus Halobonum tyrrellensis]ESP87709.1 hypothetical protein K933_12850 [Candidatus Halobonum tyrrellensis G22]